MFDRFRGRFPIIREAHFLPYKETKRSNPLRDKLSRPVIRIEHKTQQQGKKKKKDARNNGLNDSPLFSCTSGKEMHIINIIQKRTSTNWP